MLGLFFCSLSSPSALSFPSSYCSFSDVDLWRPRVNGKRFSLIFIYLFYLLHNISFYHHKVSTHHTMKWTTIKKKQSLRRKETKTDKFYPLYPLSCRLSHRQISTLQGIHIAVAIHNCVCHQGLGFIIQAMPHSLPLTDPPSFTPILLPSLCLPNTQTSP